MVSTFVKGSSTFTCSCCDHLTRWTGEQGTDSKTCPTCWDLAGFENAEQDDQMTESYIEEVRSQFAYLKANRTPEQYAKALRSFDLIAHYVTEEKENPKMTKNIAIIDLANLAVQFTDNAGVASSTDHYVAASQEDLNDLTGPQLVALYNTTAKELNTGIAEVSRFATKDAGVKRLWANLQDLAEARAEQLAVSIAKSIKEADAKNAAPIPAPAKKAAPVAPRRGTGINLPPMKKAYPCRAGSKQAILVDMLSRVQGATMRELLEALSGGAKPWKEVSVKSGMNWDMNKVKGYGIRTVKRFEEDCYHLVLPSGMTAPVPHTVKKGA
jgi:hypothetical protein